MSINAFFGRPALEEKNALVSSKNLMVKFLTKRGWGTVHGEQFSSRGMYFATIDQHKRDSSSYFDSSTIFQPSDDGFLHPTFEAKIRSNMTKKPVYARYIFSRSERKMVDANSIEEDKIIIEFDCHGEAKRINSIKVLEETCIHPDDSTKMVKVRKELDSNLKKDLIRFLKTNKDIFAWSYLDMVQINPSVVLCAKYQSRSNPHWTEKRQLDKVWSNSLKAEVERLLENGFIQEIYYPNGW